jgi:hypothetical protein
MSRTAVHDRHERKGAGNVELMNVEDGFVVDDTEKIDMVCHCLLAVL